MSVRYIIPPIGDMTDEELIAHAQGKADDFKRALEEVKLRTRFFGNRDLPEAAFMKTETGGVQNPAYLLRRMKELRLLRSAYEHLTPEERAVIFPEGRP